ncbi:MAG: hypothetical protein ACTSRZ_04825, partial [Promethearchaeota archaeon]
MKLFLVKEGNLVEQDKLVFSTGDAYIIDDNSKIWIWLGKDCSVDEKGSAAILARRLDEERGGAAKIITIEQGSEVPEFIALVDGVRILDKNLAKTMLKDVQTGSFAGAGEFENALYRVSSEEFEDINAMQFIQVPFEKASLDSEDVFIADLGDKIWIWQGKDCNVKEKVKAREFATKFDAERAGAQPVTVFEEGDDAEFIKVLEEGYKMEMKGPDLKPEVPKGETETDTAAEEEAKRKAEEEAKRKAEEEAKRKAEEEAKRKAEEEA